MDRKEFLQTAGRASILVGMAAMVGLFYKQNKLTLYGDCPSDLACRGCSKLSGCSLPEAINEKENGKG